MNTGLRFGLFAVPLSALIAGCGGNEPAASQAATVAVPEEAFRDVTGTAFNPTPLVIGFPGQALFDYDDDGDIDVFVTNTVTVPNMFYANDGLGRFVFRGNAANLLQTDDSFLATGLGDFDNDGWLDLVLSRQAGFSDEIEVDDRLMFLKNSGPDEEGIVRFEDVAERTGLDAVRYGMSIGVGDIDNDGLLDLYIGRYNLKDVSFDLISYLPDMPNVLLRNTGVVDGVPRFEDITDAAGVAGTRIAGLAPDTAQISNRVHTWAVMFTDVNEDGWQDIFALQEVPGGVDLFINNGDLTFRNAHADLLNRHGGWMGIAQGDFDRDGHIDYFLANVGADAKAPLIPNHVERSWMLPDGSPYHRLLKNDGAGGLVDVAPQVRVVPSTVLPPTNELGGSGLAGYEFGFGAAFFDMDNDGWLDLHWIGDITPGSPSALRRDFHGVGRLLVGDGSGGFVDRTAERGLFDLDAESPLGFGFNQAGRALAAIDLNGDGFCDVARTATFGPDGAENGFTCLFNPALEAGHWIIIRLNGTRSNRFGIGARVEGRVGDRIYVGEVITTTSSFTSVHPQVHFGLGEATALDSLVIRWPSGIVTELADVAADRILTIEEQDMSLPDDIVDGTGQGTQAE